MSGTNLGITRADMLLLGPAPKVNAVARASAEPRDWVFTFGSGHRAYAAHDRFSPEANANRGKGFRLDNRYVVIHGTHHTALQRMREVFGEVCWSAHYSTPEAAGVYEYGLTELVITDG